MTEAPKRALAPAGAARAPGFAKLSIAALALMVAGISVITARPRGGRHRLPPPRPVKPVDLDRYLGRWYEFARMDAWFERGMEAVTADYSLRPDGLIRVVNAGRRNNRLRWREGRARAVPGTDHNKLRVRFFPLVWADYWILDHAEDYSWSIVGEGSRRYFWILTRTPRPAPDEQARLLARARALGYDIARLHLTRHD